MSTPNPNTSCPIEPEWLITNELGGFSMGTYTGVPSRRYHGWLIAPQRPPLDRVVALHSVADWVEHEGQTSWLSAFRFEDGTIGPGRHPDTSACDGEHWDASWRMGETVVGRSVRLIPGKNRVEVRYVWRRLAPGATIRVRPLVPLRDFHALEIDAAPTPADIHEAGVRLRREHLSLQIDLPAIATFHRDPQVWQGFRYDIERDRGYDWIESLPSAGVIELKPESGHEGEAVLGFELEPAVPQIQSDPLPNLDESPQSRLARASRSFVVRRGPSVAEADGWSILAGYPWFSDWGRDTMIALPGLLLEDGRYDIALKVLSTFASACRDGLIPNRFSDDGIDAEYNTADASLWFLHAATQWAIEADRADVFREQLLPACNAIIDAHLQGTGVSGEFQIGIDPNDGLIHAGNASTQLTWMDALRDGVVFTPRHGKPIELAALWQHGLERVCQLSEPSERSLELRALASLARASIQEKMFDADRGWCADRLEPTESGWKPIWELRPNQLFAVSLEHGCLTEDAALASVEACIEHLWSPRGVRTLAPSDPSYRGRFSGPIFERDAAYHQGTAWPWLLGPMIEAWLRTGGSPDRARQMLTPMIEELDGPCPGQLYEVYDGDGWSGSPEQWSLDQTPPMPGGCPAQAWSVSEVRRALSLIRKAEASSGHW